MRAAAGDLVICQSCRDGGNLIAAVDLSYDFISEGDVAEARKLHDRCPGGTWCDCQHELPEPATEYREG